MSGTDISALMYIGFIILGVTALYSSRKGYISNKNYYIYLTILLVVGVVAIQPIN